MKLVIIFMLCKHWYQRCYWNLYFLNKNVKMVYEKYVLDLRLPTFLIYVKYCCIQGSLMNSNNSDCIQNNFWRRKVFESNVNLPLPSQTLWIKFLKNTEVHIFICIFIIWRSNKTVKIFILFINNKFQDVIWIEIYSKPSTIYIQHCWTS